MKYEILSSPKLIKICPEIHFSCKNHKCKSLTEATDKLITCSHTDLMLSTMKEIT